MKALERRAREILAPEVYDFFAGGAGGESTLARNVEAWQSLDLRPRALVDVSEVDTAVEVVGLRLEHPVGVAPVAYQGLLHSDAERATAVGAAAARALNIVSTRATVGLAEVAASAPTGHDWFQVYILRDRGWTEALAREAAEAGYGALVLTGDTPILGRKKRDERNAFVVPEDVARGNLRGARAAAEASQDPSASWDDIHWLGQASGLPVLVKGVLRADDAVRSIEAGASGVIVSNHGGRQLDGAIATADALPEIAEALRGRGAVLVDGGIRSGVDVVRAMALGADAVLLGRPIAWALATGGAGGVSKLLCRLRDEVAQTLALAGCRSPADCGPDLVRRR